MVRPRGSTGGKYAPTCCVALATLALIAAEARAHPLGNFAVCRYARLHAGPDALAIRYVIDMAEIPTVAERRRLDADGDGGVSPTEERAYLDESTAAWLARLSLTVGDRPVAWTPLAADLELLPGQGGLATLRVVLDARAAWPAPPAGPTPVAFVDRNFPARAGWKEVVATAGPGVRLRGSTVPTEGRSRELTAYQADAIPPQVTEARFTLVPRPTAGPAGSIIEPPPPAPAAGPRDPLADAVAVEELGPGLVLAGLAVAFALGAFHALSPGHGKAMVAAYLVGQRGNARHALLLGAVVTFTHTIGVFALGVVCLAASRYIVPETLYPILGGLSGLTILGLGLGLLQIRARRLLSGPPAPSSAVAHHHHDHHQHNRHNHYHHHSHHEHYHRHDHDHDDDHHHHDHQHHDHTHMPDGPITIRGLVALGVSGGLVPCPTALVVLLAAVALHRVAYGLLLIASFSLGLASVLVALGLLVVYARRWLEGLPAGRGLLRYLPVASAAGVALIGAALIARAIRDAASLVSS